MVQDEHTLKQIFPPELHLGSDTDTVLFNKLKGHFDRRENKACRLAIFHDTKEHPANAGRHPRDHLIVFSVTVKLNEAAYLVLPFFAGKYGAVEYGTNGFAKLNTDTSVVAAIERLRKMQAQLSLKPECDGPSPSGWQTP